MTRFKIEKTLLHFYHVRVLWPEGPYFEADGMFEERSRLAILLHPYIQHRQTMSDSAHLRMVNATGSLVQKEQNAVEDGFAGDVVVVAPGHA